VKTERDKMLAGERYDPRDPDLALRRQRTRLLLRDFNLSRDDEPDRRREILRDLLGHPAHLPWIEPPFHCDYGDNIRIGQDVYFNFGCVVLDVAEIAIGDRVLFGPGVHLYAATHPIHPDERRSGLEYGKPIRIGADAWIGGHAVVCPGVVIGEGTVVGAGSVVVRDLPARVVAAGNPCRILRPIPDA
jgi:maltose O-acetyltransferase